MRTFIFKMYTRINSTKQEFLIGQKQITAKNYDEANLIFSRQDLPFHSFTLVELIKP